MKILGGKKEYLQDLGQTESSGKELTPKTRFIKGKTGTFDFIKI